MHTSELLTVAVNILAISEAHQVPYIRSAALLMDIYEQLGDKVLAVENRRKCEEKYAEIMADKTLMNETAYELPKTFRAEFWKNLVPVEYR